MIIVRHPHKGRDCLCMNLLSVSADCTFNIGRAITKYLNKGDIICLFGELGSGKTLLTKGIGSGLGVKKNKVISPSFVLIRHYKAKFPIYHFDLYRLDRPEDIFALGYEDLFYNKGICIIEWADRLGSFLPKEFLKIELKFLRENQRLLNFFAKGSRYKLLLEKIYAHIRN